MNILIKGMEMPTSCAVCDWSSYVGNGRAMCLKTCLTEKTDIMSNRRPDWCPLIEVPPHGRLVDADVFKETIDYYIREADWSDAHNEALGWAKEFIDNEQAVIEAEVEDVASHTRQLARQAGKILVDAALNAIKESEGSEQ